MDNYPLPVFNIDSEDEESEEENVSESKEINKNTANSKCENLQKLLTDRSIYSHTNNPNAIVKKLEAIAEENLLNKDLKEVVSLNKHLCHFTFSKFLLRYRYVLCQETLGQHF